MRNCGDFRRFSEESSRVSLQLRLHGGGRSHERTLLRLKFPANREKYREFREFDRPIPVVSGPKRFILRNFFRQSQVFALNRTGNYQGLIREFKSAYQGIKSPPLDVA